MLDSFASNAEPTRLIIVDDCAIDRERLRRAVATAFPNVEIIEASTVVDAVNLIESHRLDCVLTDYHLCDGTGLDLALQIACRVDDPVPPPIVMVTADEQTDIAVNAMRVGVYDFVLKSTLAPTSVQRAVSHAMEKAALQRANVDAHRALFVQAEELQRSNEALSQFAAVASHDLKEPLRTIGGFSGLLERRYSDKLDDKGREYLEFICDAVVRMDGLIEGLLQFAKVGQELTMQPVDLNQVVADCEASLKSLIDTNNAMIDVADLPVIMGDQRLITQLFQNLITNAIKFRGECSPEVRIDASLNHGVWHVAVADNGIGIKPDHFERIFKIFSRLHSHDEYGGSGIGLALCKRIAEHHKGRITVASEPGHGSCFTVELPVMENQPAKVTTENRVSESS